MSRSYRCTGSSARSFVTLTAERARNEAPLRRQRSSPGAAQSRMHGIPYCLKDIYETAGIRTTAQSKLLADNVPRGTPPASEAGLGGRRLARQERDVGIRPWRRVVGRAVSAGPQSVEHRAFTGGLILRFRRGGRGRICAGHSRLRHRGSIRGPAAACGIAGLKPTYGSSADAA